VLIRKEDRFKEYTYPVLVELANSLNRTPQDIIRTILYEQFGTTEPEQLEPWMIIDEAKKTKVNVRIYLDQNVLDRIELQHSRSNKNNSIEIYLREIIVNNIDKKIKSINKKTRDKPIKPYKNKAPTDSPMKWKYSRKRNYA
jgi:hypothetical protein